MWTLTLAVIPVLLSTCYYLFLGLPTAYIDKAFIVGVNSGSVDKFLGIRFAQAPRLDLPIPISSYIGPITARKYGSACIQQKQNPVSDRFPIPPPLPDQSEDCLSLNVIVPKGTKASDRLPVAFNIHGGGFQIGSSETLDAHAIRQIDRSIELGAPMIVVSINYRLSGYGFLSSKEVKQEGMLNLGLYDQREALKWVQRYIHAFGGDPARVTINGISAGGMFTTYHMLAFGGRDDSLFAGAFGQSGAVLPGGEISKGQIHYDSIVKDTGCENSKNTLHCLRDIPLDKIIAAIDKTPDLFSYDASIIWLPRVDGKFLQDTPYSLIQQGKIASVPFVSGNADDEGTIAALQHTNQTLDQHFEEWVKHSWFRDATPSQLEPLFNSYTSLPSDGSPFGTGDENQLYPQFKRKAAFIGDIVFQAPRRYLLKYLAKNAKQKIWSYLITKSKNTPYLGSFHSVDAFTGAIDDELIYFVNSFNPNPPIGTGRNVPIWPEYDSETRALYTINDEGAPYIMKDDYREEAIEQLSRLSVAYPPF